MVSVLRICWKDLRCHVMFGFLFLMYCKYYIFLFYWTNNKVYKNSKKNVTNQSPLKKPQSTSTGNDYSVPYLGWFMDFIGGYFVQSIVDEFVRPKTSFILSFLTASFTEVVLNQFLNCVISNHVFNKPVFKSQSWLKNLHGIILVTLSENQYFPFKESKTFILQ